MKQIITLSLFCLCSFVMYAQVHDNHNHAVSQTDVTKITGEDVLIFTQLEHDFGKIPQGKPVTYVFEITNTGKTPLKLDNVQASCGCTTPEWDKVNLIPAGSKGKITVGYNAAAEGSFNKPITITYNSTQTRQITIKGEVWKTPAASAPINAGLNDLKN